MASTNLKKGEVLAGKFRVEKVLGAGGMGMVLSAWHLELNMRVALKLLRPAALEDRDAVERFSREARAASRLQSEHAARVLDVGKLADGTPYMLMEYLVGTDLGHVLAQRRLQIAEAVIYLLQACEAIAEAHALGIVHRDIKPGNIFLTRRIDGHASVKVLDFGLAKSVRQNDSGSLTSDFAVMGSPQYMSPEQMKASRDVDARSDIWSLGVCLYELVTGKTPFEGATVPEICAMVMKDSPRPANELRPEIPQALSDVMQRCLERDPARRFPDVASFVGALEPFGPPAAVGAGARIRQIVLLSSARAQTQVAPIMGDAEPLTIRAAEEATQLGLPMADTRTAASFDAGHPRGRTRTFSLALLGLGALGVLTVVILIVAAGGDRTERGAGAGSSEPLEVPARTAVADNPPPPVATPLLSMPPASPDASDRGATNEGRGARPQPVRPPFPRRPRPPAHVPAAPGATPGDPLDTSH